MRSRAGAGNVPAAGNVPDADGNVSEADGGNVSSPARLMDKIDPQDERAPDLLARLLDAAGGNVAPGAADVAPIQVLLAQAAISTSTSCRSSARSQRAQCRSSGGTSHG
jgi:hypothetical protein